MRNKDFNKNSKIRIFLGNINFSMLLETCVYTAQCAHIFIYAHICVCIYMRALSTYIIKIADICKHMHLNL